jgi:glucose-6-phosphate isomerase
MNNITELKEWQALIQHQQDMTHHHMRDWFADDLQRFSKFSLQNGDIFIDYSRNRITDQTLKLLCDLAFAVGLPQKIDALLAGHPVNTTENRPALHTALRNMSHTPIILNGENIDNLVSDARTRMYDFVNKIHSHAWRGITGKPMTDIVNIGIGGSCLGPMMTTEALKDFSVANLTFHFISSVDKNQLNDVLTQIDPETTLFIISSKSFSTLETITNAKTIMRWMKAKLGTDTLSPHFIAVTAAPEKALALGITPDQIFPVWDWVGGRYSIWSPIGLPLALMIGAKNFDAFLSELLSSKCSGHCSLLA